MPFPTAEWPVGDLPADVSRTVLDAAAASAFGADDAAARVRSLVVVKGGEIVSEWLGGLGADMTTRDFARFGLLHLRGGEWDGRQILPESWIDATRVPAPTNADYGLQWWLGADARFRRVGAHRRGSLVPSMFTGNRH